MNKRNLKIPSILRNALGTDDMSMKGISSIAHDQNNSSPDINNDDIEDEITFDDYSYGDEDEYYYDEDDDEDSYLLDTDDIRPVGVDSSMQLLAVHIKKLFHYAIGGEEDAMIELLEKTQLHPDAEDGAGHTPFLVAARHGQLGVMKRLLSDGCNPSHRTRNGNSAWMLAAAAGKLETLKFLMEYVGPNIPTKEFESVLVNKNKDTILMFGAMAGCTEIVRYLLNMGNAAGVLQSLPQGPNNRMHPLSLFYLNSDGLTAVMCACESTNIDTINLLLVAVQDAFGELDDVQQQTIDIENDAFLKGFEDMGEEGDFILGALLSLGGHNMPKKARKKNNVVPHESETAAYLNHCDTNGNTALHVASKLIHTAPVVDLLLTLGADPSLKNTSGLSAEDIWDCKGDDIKNKMIEFREMKTRHADILMMELLGEDKKKKKKGKKGDKKHDDIKKVDEIVPITEITNTPLVEETKNPLLEITLNETQKTEETLKSENEQLNKKKDQDKLKNIKKDEESKTKIVVNNVDEKTRTGKNKKGEKKITENIETPPTKVSVTKEKKNVVIAESDNENWTTVGKKTDFKKTEVKVEKKSVKKDEKKKNDRETKTEKKLAKSPAVTPIVTSTSSTSAASWASKLINPSSGSSVQTSRNITDSVPLFSSPPPSLTSPPVFSLTDISPPPGISSSPLSIQNHHITVTATTTPSPIPPVANTTNVQGAMTRQLYRLEPKSEALALTPLHILGNGISSLSNEQVSCVESVLDLLLNNIRRVKQVRATKAQNELSQQLAEAQSLIAALNMQVDELKKDNK